VFCNGRWLTHWGAQARGSTRWSRQSCRCLAGGRETLYYRECNTRIRWAARFAVTHPGCPLGKRPLGRFHLYGRAASDHIGFVHGRHAAGSSPLTRTLSGRPWRRTHIFSNDCPWPLCLPVASASGQKPNDPKASTEGGIHEPRVADSRASGLADLGAFWVAGLGALLAAGLRVEWVAGLIGIRRACQIAEVAPSGRS